MGCFDLVAGDVTQAARRSDIALACYRRPTNPAPFPGVQAQKADLAFLETGDWPEGGLSDAQFDALMESALGTDVKVDVVMKLLGLWHVRDTVVGNEELRGVSGAPSSCALIMKLLGL